MNSAEHLTWIARIRVGDQSAFEAMFRAYSDRLCAFAGSYVGSVEVAEEVVEDVFFSIWQGRGHWEITTSLQSYLYTATRNRSLNYLKRGRLERRYLEGLAGEPPPLAGAADAEVLAGDLHAAASRAIGELPDRCREIFLLQRQHGLSYAEIAAILEITPKTVENQMGRALKMLREKLAPYI